MGVERGPFSPVLAFLVGQPEYRGFVNREDSPFLYQWFFGGSVPPLQRLLVQRPDG